MTRASLLAATLAASFLLFVPFAGATDSSGLRVTVLKVPAFPQRTLVLSFPHRRALHARGVRVTENTYPVSHIRVVPASKASLQTFGVVLVLDTSCSMQGKALAAAQAAEQSFFNAYKASHNLNEALGMINFSDSATTVLPLTTSQPDIQAALGKAPHIACGTHIFDAVARAEGMLRAGNINSGSIIVLSDGADTGSKASLDAVAHRALARNVRIYTVGLDDATYRPDTLTSLATAGGGEYVQAKAEGLAPLFTRLGRVLASEFLISYTSRFGDGQLVHVGATVQPFGTATTSYRTPPLPAASTGKSPSIGARIFTSPVTMVILAVVIGSILAVLIIGIAQPRRSGLPGRIAEFVSIQELQRQPTATAAVDGAPAVEKDWWGNFRETLEIARINVEPELIVAGTAIGTILAFIFIFAITGSPWWALFALLVPYFVREWVLRSLKRQRTRFAEQLPEALQVIASALRSGHSFAGSLAVVVESSSDPMRSEMQRVVADEQLGIPIQRSISVVADRMASRDLDQLALVAELQRQAGGDMAEVIDRVAETVRERFDLRRLVETLTTQGRMSRWIVSLLPLVILLFLQFENPHYLHPLVASTAGKVVVGLAAAWAVAGSLIIKRIVEIEV